MEVLGGRELSSTLKLFTEQQSDDNEVVINSRAKVWKATFQTMPWITSMFRHYLVDTSIHALTNDVIPKIVQYCQLIYVA